MKAIAIAAAGAAMLALAACDRLGIGGGGNLAGNDSGNASANASAEAGKDPAGSGEPQAAAGGKDPAAGGGAIPAGAGGIVLDRAFLTGRWTDSDCSAAVEFLDDGRFITHRGAEGLWHLAGNRLTLQGDRTVTMELDPVDRNVMNVVNEDGSLGRSTRC